MIKEKIGNVFSITKENQPVKGCTISKSVYEKDDFRLTYFSLAEGTDISAESYCQAALIIVLKGRATVYGKKINEGQIIFLAENTLFGVNADTDCVYIEILFAKGSNMECNMEKMKNLNAGEVFSLKNLLPYQDEKIVNMDITRDEHLKLVLMSFDEGTSLSEHAAPGEAVIFALEGNGIIGYEGNEYKIKEGENFCFAKNGKHYVKADGKFKIALLLLF